MEQGKSLARHLRALLPGKAHNPVPAQILTELREWQRGLPTDQHKARERAKERGQGGPDAASGVIEGTYWGRAFGVACQDFPSLRESDYPSLLAPTWQLLEDIRRRAREGLDGRSWKAWELGESIQRGLCPSLVFRVLYRQERSVAELWAIRGIARMASQYREDFDFTAPDPTAAFVDTALDQTVNFVNQRGYDPGEVRPDHTWAGHVRERWGPLGMPGEPPQGLQEAAGSGWEAAIRGLVNHLAEVAERGLAGLQLRSRGDGGAMEQRDRWIYEQCCKMEEGRLLQHKEILRRLRQKITGGENWDGFGSIQRISQVAEEYAEDHGLDPPPKRRNL
jgi:hypothetical protein